MSETKPGALNRLWSSKASAIAAVVVIALVVLSIGALIVWNTIDNTKAAPAGAEGGMAATAPATAATTTTAPGGCDVPLGTSPCAQQYLRIWIGGPPTGLPGPYPPPPAPRKPTLTGSGSASPNPRSERPS